MSIDHELVIKLAAEDIAKIITEYVNKGLSNDFRVSVDQIKFDLMVTDKGGVFTGATAKADYVHPTNRRIS